MTVIYAVNQPVSVQEFQGILEASGLGERRPVGDVARLEMMLRHANLTVTAREDGRIIGIARALSDFSYCCYLSDLAVAKDRQRQGIGRRLIEEVRKAAGAQANLLLLSAPATQSYYPAVGMKTIANGWIIMREG